MYMHVVGLNVDRIALYGMYNTVRARIPASKLMHTRIHNTFV